MSDRKELLKSMLSNFINDNTSQAEIDLHQYLTAKSQSIITRQNGQPEVTDIPDAQDID